MYNFRLLIVPRSSHWGRWRDVQKWQTTLLQMKKGKITWAILLLGITFYYWMRRPLPFWWQSVVIYRDSLNVSCRSTQALRFLGYLPCHNSSPRSECYTSSNMIHTICNLCRFCAGICVKYCYSIKYNVSFVCNRFMHMTENGLISKWNSILSPKARQCVDASGHKRQQFKLRDFVSAFVVWNFNCHHHSDIWTFHETWQKERFIVPLCALC